MGIVQGARDLAHIGQELPRRETRASGVPLSQRAPWRVVHHQIGDAALHAKVQHPHDRGVFQVGNRPRLLAEACDLLCAEPGAEHLDGCVGPQVIMLAEIDFGKAALTEQAHQPILANVLANAIRHVYPPVCLAP